MTETTSLPIEIRESLSSVSVNKIPEHPENNVEITQTDEQHAMVKITQYYPVVLGRCGPKHSVEVHADKTSLTMTLQYEKHELYVGGNISSKTLSHLKNVEMVREDANWTLEKVKDQLPKGNWVIDIGWMVESIMHPNVVHISKDASSLKAIKNFRDMETDRFVFSISFRCYIRSPELTTSENNSGITSLLRKRTQLDPVVFIEDDDVSEGSDDNDYSSDDSNSGSPDENPQKKRKYK